MAPPRLLESARPLSSRASGGVNATRGLATRHSRLGASLDVPNRIRAASAERTTVTPLRPRPVVLTAATALLGLAGAARAAVAVHPEFLPGEQAYTASHDVAREAAAPGKEPPATPDAPCGPGSL